VVLDGPGSQGTFLSPHVSSKTKQTKTASLKNVLGKKKKRKRMSLVNSKND
jgi:hypothetical protein